MSRFNKRIYVYTSRLLYYTILSKKYPAKSAVSDYIGQNRQRHPRFSGFTFLQRPAHLGRRLKPLDITNTSLGIYHPPSSPDHNTKPSSSHRASPHPPVGFHSFTTALNTLPPFHAVH